MSERNLLIGTAGHVDHGKSKLIEALTGIQTDRLKEEQERGISIELGFAHLTLPNGKKAGIVDVPGHEKFVRQMLAGASGMDVVLLIIAADEGVMPQTTEHLHILSILQIKKGIVVLTKIDLVDQDWLKMITEDAKEKLKGSFLEEAPFCPVSALTGEGLPNLLQTIVQVLDQAEGRPVHQPARMPIDRVFTIQGFGTVVTGTVHAGVFHKGQEVLVEPGALYTKVRNIQVHGKSVAQTYAGQRAAINISNVSVGDLERGASLVAPGVFRSGTILDVEVFNLASEKKPIGQRQRIHFHIGTAETLGRVHLLDTEELRPGEKGYGQILLEEPVLAVPGEPFVIRYYSPITTIGGGTVIGLAPQKRKRFREKVLEELRIRAKGSPQELILKELKDPLLLGELEKKTALPSEELTLALESLERENHLVTLPLEEITLYWSKDQAIEWGNRVVKEIGAYQKSNPLRCGMGREELKRKMKMELPLKHWQAVIEWGCQEKIIQVAGNQVETKPPFQLPSDLQKKMDCLVHAWEIAGLNPPELKRGAKECGISEKDLQDVCNYMVCKGKWQKIGEFFLSVSAVEKAQEELGELLSQKEKISASEARDHWQTSRKYAIPLLEYFDSIRYTKRDGDVRTLC